MSEPGGHIHREHPFAAPPEQRQPGRTLRGRLAAPVTVWTAGAGAERAGLTVSSLIVAEGEPPHVLGIVVPTSDLWDALQDTEAFVVHVLDERSRVLAERFAGVRPSPGGLFAGLDVDDTPWGPALTSLGTRAMCRLVQAYPTAYHYLVRGSVEEIEAGDLQNPLVYFRGQFRKLSD